MNKISLFIILCFLAITSHAQTAANYVYARTTGTFTTIAGGSGTTATTAMSSDDGNLSDVPIGFSFTFCGTTYTTISACANGWLSLANSSSTAYDNTAANVPGPGFLMPFWDDLDGGVGTATAYYQTSGTAPNRIFTFQWGNGAAAMRWGNLTGTGRADFQVKLYESSNVLQFVYGTGNFAGNSATIGIANSSSDRETITSAAATSAGTTFATGIATSPAANSVMTWTPAPTIAATPSSMEFTVVAGATSSAQPVTLKAYGLTASSVTVTAPTNFQVYNGSSWVTTTTVATSTAALGTYINTTVLVRFVGPSTVGVYTGNVTFSSTGATTQNVAVTGNATAPCAGTPTAGTSTVSPTIGGAATPFTLTLSGYTLLGGITFQWQSSPDATTWTDISGATLTTYNFTGITANKYFRCQVTCVPSSTTATSSQCMATFLAASSCTPAYFDAPANTEGLNNFTITGYSSSVINDNGTSPHPANGYEDRTSLVTAVNLMQGSGYSGSVTYTPSDYYYENQIFIDFNNDGIFQSTENVTPVFGAGACTTSIGTETFTVTIPALAAVGLHRMRIRNALTYSCTLSGAMDPCANFDSGNDYYYGTTRDYVVNIVPLPVCTGTPAAGTVSATSTTGCAGFNPTLSLSGTTLASGLTYQWQSSPNNITWSSISGATNNTYIPTVSTATYYRCVITCTPSSTTVQTPGLLINTVTCYSMTFGALNNATTCNAMFYDDGGPTGVYNPGSGNSGFTFYPGATGTGSKVSVHFNTFVIETCCDWVKIYNGNTVSPATLIGTYTSIPPDITSTAADGSLTFVLHSDGSISYAGFEAVITNTSVNPITAQPAASTPTCQLGTTSIAVTTVGTNTYQWYNNGSTNSTTGGTLIAGATNAAYSPSTAITGTTYYYATVKTACNAAYTTTTAAVVVNPLPAAITGNNTVCAGLTTVYNDATAGGTWSSSAVTIATAGTGSGIITGVAAGTSRITYTLTSTGCTATKIITVNPLPAAITGTMSFCAAATTTLASATTGGTWSSGTTGIATVDASGVVTGIAAGLSVITYTLPTSCITTASVTVNPLPALTVSPSSLATICAGDSATFIASAPVDPFTILAQDFNSGLGTWSITNISGTPASFWQLAASPAYSSTVGDGSTMLQAASEVSGSTNTILLSPSFSTVGFGSATLTFNEFLVSAVPDDTVSVEYSLNGGTTWSTLLDQLDAFVGAGTWTAAAPEATVSLPAAALGQADVKLRWKYKASSYYWFIDNIAVKALVPPATYAWSGAAGLSCTTCTTQTITPTAVGANLYTVTATSSAGCIANNGVTVSVNPLPSAITGSTTVCTGASITLANASGGGTWASSTTANATINAASGLLTGIVAGTATITYTLATGCTTTTVITVNPSPAAIAGTAAVCAGLTTTLSESFTGGNWSSSATGVATVTAAGLVTGVTAGNANISYTMPTGCYALRVVTVNPLPAAIAGPSAVCEGASITLTDADAGGTWTSSATANATITAAGVVTGIASGTPIITYTLPTSCIITSTISVNQSPAAITGTLHVCAGLTTALADATPSGTWSSQASATASVSATGVVTGGIAGNTNISYTLSDGCYSTAAITVDPLPAAITGNLHVCENSATLLASASTGGTWSSSAPGTATVIAATGSVTGVVAGNATITYTLPTGCITTIIVTVDPLPAAITGTLSVCENYTTTLANVTAGGTWSSSASAIASVDASGIVSGIAAGNADINYTLPTGCMSAATVTVNHTPAAITGTAAVCEGLTTLLANTDAGGNWSTSAAATAGVDATGLVTGVAAGNATISYTLSTGCYNTIAVTVNPLPAAITGPTVVCEASAITLGDATTGGTWSTGGAGVASVDASGIVTGISAGNESITYTLPTGCIATASILVNPLPAPVTGTMQVCAGLTAALASATSGGTWSSSATAIATISTAGVVTGVTAGNAAITYTLPTGCLTTAGITVNPLPAAITGSNTVCEGLSITLADATASGTWSGTPAGLLSIDATGTATGISAGVVSVTYTLPTGCIATRQVTVNPTPAPVTGTLHVCEGLTTMLSSASAGGTWSSGNTSVATVSVSGIVSGILAGQSAITYTLPAGCIAAAIVTVDPLPAAITGNMVICAGTASMLANTAAGGTWSSNTTAVATIDATGLVTAVAAGAATITYTLPTGCISTATVTVNPLPAPVIGNTSVCQGLTTLFTNATAGGSWSSSDATVAPINTSGLATGQSVGFAVISYTLPTGCYMVSSLVVNPLPADITGTASVCAGLATTFSTTTPDGTWSSSSAAATVSDAGVVIGVATGTAVISYTLGTGCIKTRIVTINPLPALITGATNVCTGATVTLTNTAAGGEWSSSAANATVGSTSGIVTGIAEGAAVITYTLPTGCARTKTVFVNPPVAAITGTMAICRGGDTYLSDPTAGGVWVSSNTSVASVGAATGLVNGIAAGTATITYSVSGTGCTATAVITINALPGTISGTTAICAGSSAALTSSSAGGTWLSSDASIVAIDASGNVTAIAPGGALVTYTLPTGCARTAAITVSSLPASNGVTGGGSYCAGGSGVEIDLDGSALFTNYKLYNGASVVTSVSGSGSALSFGLQTAPATYSVVATNAEGCSSAMTGTAVISVAPSVVPSVSITADNGLNVCEGTLVTYTSSVVNGGTAPAYTWKVNGVSLGTASTFAYTPANGDIVMATVTSSASCALPLTASAAVTMTVTPSQMPTIAITTTSEDVICLHDAAAFSASIAYGGTAPVITWLKNGMPTGITGSAYSYMPAPGDVITAKLNSNFTCRLADSVISNAISLTVDSIYRPVVTITANPGLVINQGQDLMLTATTTGAGPAPSYQWVLNGTAVTGATNNTYTSFTFANNDIVTCYVYGTGRCGLGSLNAVTITVNKATGVAPVVKVNSTISLVPNPNNGTFTVAGMLQSAANGQEAELEITNMLGQVIYRNKVITANGKINEQIHLDNTLANGMYILNMRSGAESSQVHFVIAQ